MGKTFKNSCSLQLMKSINIFIVRLIKDVQVWWAMQHLFWNLISSGNCPLRVETTHTRRGHMRSSKLVLLTNETSLKWQRHKNIQNKGKTIFDINIFYVSRNGSLNEIYVFSRTKQVLILVADQRSGYILLSKSSLKTEFLKLVKENPIFNLHSCKNILFFSVLIIFQWMMWCFFSRFNKNKMKVLI